MATAGGLVFIGAAMDRYLRALRLPDADIRSIQLMNKDSLEMTGADRA